MGQEEPPHKGRATEDRNLQCKNITKRLTRARTGRGIERKQHEMRRDRARRRKEESFTTLQSGHLLYHSEANNGQAGVGFLVNKKWKDNITRVSSVNSRFEKLVLCITDRYQLKIVQVYAPTTSHSDDETDNFYNTIDKILEKQTHYTIVMGDFNAKV